MLSAWCINRNSWEKTGMNGLSPDLLEFCLLIANYWPSSLFWLQRWLMHHLSLEDPAVMICHLCWFRIMAIQVVEFSSGGIKLERFLTKNQDQLWFLQANEAPRYISPILKFNNFLWICWFSGKNLSNILPPFEN